MNSVEEITGYMEDKLPYYSPTFKRRTAASYDLPDNNSTKKDKKWSIGSLFRRKKKENSDTSSDEESQKKSFLKKKKKPDKKKKAKSLGTFDHIVLTPSAKKITVSNGYNNHDDVGILSDPAGGFGNYIGRALPKIPTPGSDISSSRLSKTSSNDMQMSHHSLESSDSLTKHNRRGRTKARAELRRGYLKADTSSDEESQRSASASSNSRLRSDENLRNHRDNSASRKSRAARTERYIRRLSKEEEKILNKEAQLIRAYKSDVENCDKRLKSNNKSPIFRNLSYQNHDPGMTGLSTIPPREHYVNKHKIAAKEKGKPPPAHENVLAKHAYLEVPNDFNNYRSYSCEANIHKSPSPELLSGNVIHAHLPLTKPHGRRNNISLIELHRLDKQPPPPPPRDPRRVLTKQPDNTRPLSFNFDKDVLQRKTIGPQLNRSHNLQAKNCDINKSRSLNWHPGYRSNSEDCLPTELLQGIPLVPRPSSVTPEATRSRLLRKQDRIDNTEQIQYLMDKKPRSRKPILIQTSNDPCGDSAKTALNFWKQKDHEEKTRSNKTSPQMFTSQTHVRSNIFLPSVLKQDMERESSPFKPISPTIDVDMPDGVAFQNNTNNKTDEKERKSSNLEDALDELEAIYNSLHLGDEDLLERAEEREKTVAAQKFAQSKSESFPAWNAHRGAFSDSNFSYEPFDVTNTPKKKRLVKKSSDVDRKSDDMAFRKMHKERTTISDPQSVISSVSYLLATPIRGDETEINNEIKPTRAKKQNKEPDITLDDVVFRTIKHAKNSLKLPEPQLPFGIPLGPITPAANSDYLHAIPDDEPKSTKIPDVVKDDLAYRNLRKDTTKEPALPPLTSEDFVNNNNFFYEKTKKKRAIRSMSANIYNLMHNQEPENEFKNMDNLDDIADAMEIARQILKQKEAKLNNTNRAFLSDTDARFNTRQREDRLNFLNQMKSPVFTTKNDSKNTSLDDLINALAAEARETSEKLSSELNKQKDGVDQKLSEIEAVSDKAKLCGKLLDGVSKKLETLQLEEVEQIEPFTGKSFANVVITSSPAEEAKPMEILNDSEHDYANCGSDAEVDRNLPFIDDDLNIITICKSPFEEHKAELIAGFQELNKIENLIETDGDGEEKIDEYKNSEIEEGEEECLFEINTSHDASECAGTSVSQNNFITKSNLFVTKTGCLSYVSNCDIFVNENFDSNYKINSNNYDSDSFKNNECENSSAYALKSPKLVLKSANELLVQMDESKDELKSNSDEEESSNKKNPNSSRIFPENTPKNCNNSNNMHNSDPRHTLDSTLNWAYNPLALALACTYGLACTNQLVSLDVVTILGLVFVIISFIAAIIY